MVNEFKIIVQNRSGAVQNYKLFNEPPNVTGGVDPKVWSNVYQDADYTQPGATAVFTMWKQYYGTVGTVKGSQAEGAMVQVSQTVRVDLGELEDDGTVKMGTTLDMEVAGGRQPYFKTDGTSKNSSYAHCFAVETAPTFTVATAKSNNFMIGLAASPDGYSSAPVASLMPEPGCTYQIQPANKFYISFGAYRKLGQLADLAKIGNKCEVDFTKLPATVNVVHTETGKLVVQLGMDTVWK